VSKKDTALLIKGTEGMVVHFAQCCQPIPGDSIVGCFQQGHGILVHTSNCSAVNHMRSTPEQFISMCWDDEVKGDFLVEITVEVVNRPGVLASLATAIAEAGSNISNIGIDPRDGRHNAITFAVTVADRRHLARLMRRLRLNKMVMRLYRKRKGD
jgi:guanosine-3',5'-bis(diphosphate) 3'-pyrophosphohydrolase